jgi:single-strand DNA-binding protein
MLNGAIVTLAGYVAREPIYTKVNETIPKVIVRVAWNSRYPDRVTGEWRDGKTSFANVNCWRKMAGNVVMSLRKGQPVVVTGRLQVREYDDKEGRHRIVVDIEADAIGHDFTRGVGHFERLRTQPEDAGAQAQPGELTGAAAMAQNPVDAAENLVDAAQNPPDEQVRTGEGQEAAGDVLNADAVAELVEAGSETAAVAVPF